MPTHRTDEERRVLRVFDDVQYCGIVHRCSAELLSDERCVDPFGTACNSGHFAGPFDLVGETLMFAIARVANMDKANFARALRSLESLGDIERTNKEEVPGRWYTSDGHCIEIVHESESESGPNIRCLTLWTVGKIDGQEVVWLPRRSVRRLQLTPQGRQLARGERSGPVCVAGADGAATAVNDAPRTDKESTALGILAAYPGWTDTRKAAAAASLDDAAMLDARTLAERFGVDQEQLRKRLERQRGNVQHTEDSNARSRDPKYLYQVGSVRPIIDSIKSKQQRPTKRPANVRRDK